MAADGASLLGVLDQTRTPMGSRMLRRWVVFPLCDLNAIAARQNGIEYFFREPEFREVCETELEGIGDLERLVSKVSMGRINPRELLQLAYSLQGVGVLRNACIHASDEHLQKLGQTMDACEELCRRIKQSIVPDAPAALGKGRVIAPGVSPELDELRAISSSGKDYLQKIQQRESEATGIPSLKIGFNNVFGYYIEVRNTHKDRVPAEWIRKQTLVSAERYITPELKEYEEKILGAEDKIAALEDELFGALTGFAAQYVEALKADADQTAALDCLLSLAEVARTHHYVRPIVDDSTDLEIVGGRHPVIETLMPRGEEYVPNDISLDQREQQIIIVTGPNMAGKSALLRQTALIVLMAQMGSYVPAEKARIGMVDKIFTRVGASDNISVGESTFMVEMSEAANIMNNLTERSLVLFDELGRGTSTYDGISIAWAIVEYLHENPNGHARTLFATHYHELNEMERLYPRVKNWNVSVKEVNGRIVFLRKLQRGGSEHSFGIHVARLAGMPQSIVRRAEQILHELEANNARNGEPIRREKLANIDQSNVQMSFFQLDDPVLQQIRDEILNLDVNNLTPVEALNKLNDIKKILNGK